MSDHTFDAFSYFFHNAAENRGGHGRFTIDETTVTKPKFRMLFRNSRFVFKDGKVLVIAQQLSFIDIPNTKNLTK